MVIKANIKRTDEVEIILNSTSTGIEHWCGCTQKLVLAEWNSSLIKIWWKRIERWKKCGMII